MEGSHNTSYALPSATLSKQTSASELIDNTDNLKIASSAPRGPQTCEERNVFAIYVSYYVKVKLALSGMGGELSLKLPFILGHVDDASITIDNKLMKNDGTTKLSDCIRSKTPTEIVEEECGADDINDDVVVTKSQNDNDEDEHHNQQQHTFDATKQCDTIQLEEQLRFSHLNVSVNNKVNTANPNNPNFDDHDDGADDDDDDDDENLHGSDADIINNVITAQIHHENQSNQQSTEQVTDC